MAVKHPAQAPERALTCFTGRWGGPSCVPPNGCVHVLTVTCGCGLLWKYGLWRGQWVKLRSRWMEWGELRVQCQVSLQEETQRQTARGRGHVTAEAPNGGRPGLLPPSETGGDGREGPSSRGAVALLTLDLGFWPRVCSKACGLHCFALAAPGRWRGRHTRTGRGPPAHRGPDAQAGPLARWAPLLPGLSPGSAQKLHTDPSAGTSVHTCPCVSPL